MSAQKNNNQSKENQQKVTNQKELLNTQEHTDARDQQIKNDGDTGRIRSERQSVKDSKENQSRH